MNESQISLEAQQDARDQADYLHVPTVIFWVMWAVLLIVLVDWVADKVRP